MLRIVTVGFEILFGSMKALAQQVRTHSRSPGVQEVNYLLHTGDDRKMLKSLADVRARGQLAPPPMSFPLQTSHQIGTSGVARRG